MDDRTTGRDRDWTDTESEGLPDTEEQPPGIDAETATDGMPLPGDQPVGAEQLGVTEREQAVSEPVDERVRRERPDVAQAPPADPRGRLTTGTTDRDDATDGEWTDDATGLSAEEAAVHLYDR